MPDQPRHHKPATPGAAFFEDLGGGADPALLREAGDRAASLLVRGARDTDDPAVVDRVLHLAETEGLETLAQVWPGARPTPWPAACGGSTCCAPGSTPPPSAVSREYDAGRARAQVARVVAGVADPPGPEELKAMVDETLRGIAGGDFADHPAAGRGLRPGRRRRSRRAPTGAATTRP